MGGRADMHILVRTDAEYLPGHSAPVGVGCVGFCLSLSLPPGLSVPRSVYLSLFLSICVSACLSEWVGGRRETILFHVFIY